tara:strand:- start:92 stop:316 length:225 start_codon:yes stop_codon:yes gene_type:complete
MYLVFATVAYRRDAVGQATEVQSWDCFDTAEKARQHMRHLIHQHDMDLLDVGVATITDSIREELLKKQPMGLED